jgi:hypothetical protein
VAGRRCGQIARAKSEESRSAERGARLSAEEARASNVIDGGFGAFLNERTRR